MSKMLCIRDFEEYAENNLDSRTWSFFRLGAEREWTLEENLKSFTRYVIIPRVLRNTTQRDLSVTVLGDRLSFPIGIAPTAHQGLAHPDGEIAGARAASEAGTLYTLSTVSTKSLDEVSDKLPKQSLLWMHIYIFKDKSWTEEIVRNAEANGYRALVLTVDVPVPGLRFKYGITSSPKRSSNIDKVLQKLNILDVVPKDTPYLAYFKANISWDDVLWLKSITSLPIVLKGILSSEDALEAVKYGASAVWVSNHGGRQLDGVPAALDVLPRISRALEGSGCEVYADGGVRWGSDVLKLLALGARAVFIGRPALWGLAHSGENGLRSVLEILKNELDKAMHLSGCNSISDIGPHLVEKHASCKM